MNDLKAVLKKYGWSDELLDSIERVSKSIPSVSLSGNAISIRQEYNDRDTVTISTSELSDSTTLFI